MNLDATTAAPNFVACLLLGFETKKALPHFGIILGVLRQKNEKAKEMMMLVVGLL